MTRTQLVGLVQLLVGLFGLTNMHISAIGHPPDGGDIALSVAFIAQAGVGLFMLLFGDKGRRA